jgi:hypothetical protein
LPNTANGIWGSNERPENTKGHYEFPYGDFRKVHRCGVLAAESRAGQCRHYDRETAAAHLHEMMEGRKAASAHSQAVASSATSHGTDTRGGRGKPDAVSAVRDLKNQAEHHTDQRTRHQRELQCCVPPLDDDVAWQPPQSELAKTGPKQSRRQDQGA